MSNHPPNRCLAGLIVPHREHKYAYVRTFSAHEIGLGQVPNPSAQSIQSAYTTEGGLDCAIGVEAAKKIWEVERGSK